MESVIPHLYSHPNIRHTSKKQNKTNKQEGVTVTPPFLFFPNPEILLSDK